MHHVRRILLIATTAALAGCAGGGKTKTQKQAAADQWAGTRAAVLASLATDQYRSGNYDKSRQTVDQAIALDGKNPRLRVLSARLDIEQGRLEAAEQSLALASTLDPKDAEIDYLRGIVQQRWQRPQAALGHYAAAAEKRADDVAFPLAQAEMLVQLDRRGEALKLLLARVQYFEHSATIRDAIAQLLQQNGAVRPAIDYYRQASVLDADDVGIRERLALALYEAGESREALSQLTRVIAAARSADANAAPRVDLMLAAAECELAIDDARAARRRFDDITSIEPNSAEAWLGSAKCSLRLSDLKRAEQSAQRAVTLRPRSVDALVVLGYALMKQGRDDAATQTFTRAIRAEPNDAVTLSMLAILARRQGQPIDAEAYLRRALATEPADPLAQRLMASVAE